MGRRALQQAQAPIASRVVSRRTTRSRTAAKAAPSGEAATAAVLPSFSSCTAIKEDPQLTTTTTQTTQDVSTSSTTPAEPGTSFQNPLFFPTPSSLSAWLSKNHATTPHLYIGYHKKHSPLPTKTITWSQAVDEALCWGWIDGHAKSLDAHRHAQRFTPRRRGPGKSHWSRVNVDKVAALEAQGRMRAPGREAFGWRTEGNTAQRSFEKGALADLSDAFRARLSGAAAAYLEARPPGYRRTVYDWVMSAKREATRERRLVELVECSEQGVYVKHLRR